MSAPQNDTARFFDEVSGRYREKYGTSSPFHHYFFNQRLERTLEGLDLEGKDILDIGSGTGDLYDAVIERWPGARFHATDISAGMLARSRVPSERKFVGAAKDHPFATKRFDLITLLGVTTYMDDEELDRHLAFVADSLRPGGIAVVSFTNAHALDHWMRQLLKPLLRLFGPSDKVLSSGLRIHPRSAAEARRAIERHMKPTALVLLNQTVFPISRLLPGPSLALARRLERVPGSSAWKRWLSSDLLFRACRPADLA